MIRKNRIGSGLVIAALLTAMTAGVAGCGTDDGSGTEQSKGAAQQTEQQGAVQNENAKPPADADYTVDMSQIASASLSPGVIVHDPSIVKSDGTYYIFGSHMAAASSEDLKDWFGIAGGYNENNPIFSDLRNKDSQAFAFSGGPESAIPEESGGHAVWAPDVKYSEKMGKYVMYYCTNSNFYTGTICWASSDTIDGEYIWQGNLIYSGFRTIDLDKTDVLDYVDESYAKTSYFDGNGNYNWKLRPHAIDPTVFWDEDGRMWMVYGSWSGGIYIIEIDEETGKVIHPEADPDNGVDTYFGKYLLGGNHQSIEGPYIIYDKEAGYYYLYVSYGALQANGGYQIRVFRSEKPDGPYVDMNGEYPKLGGGTQADYGLKLSGNYRLPSLEKAYKATGHNSAMIDEDGKRYLCYHTRFENSGENHSPRVKQYLLNEEGWPCLLPYATDGETVSESGYDTSQIVGRYYFVNQGTDISGMIAEPFIFYLTEDGGVFGEKMSGSWTMKDGTPYVKLTYANAVGKETEYSGVCCRMKDEAGTDVMVFSGVGGNSSLWGVKYDE